MLLESESSFTRPAASILWLADDSCKNTKSDQNVQNVNAILLCQALMKKKVGKGNCQPYWPPIIHRVLVSIHANNGSFPGLILAIYVNKVENMSTSGAIKGLQNSLKEIGLLVTCVLLSGQHTCSQPSQHIAEKPTALNNNNVAAGMYRTL